MSIFRSKKSAAVQPDFSGLAVQTATAAAPIPISYGVTRLAPNIIWQNGVAAIPQYTSAGGGKGGGGSTVSGYEYYCWVMYAIGEGPVRSVGTIYNGQGVYPYGSYGLSLLTGTTPQAPWGPALANAAFAPAALNYNGTAYMASSDFDLGSSASVPSIAFEVYGLLQATTQTVNGYDADPAVCVQDFLTNPQYGVGFPPVSISAATLFGAGGDASYQTYCKAAGLAFSPALTDQETANSILTRWLQLTNTAAIWSGGQLKFVPYGDMAIIGATAAATFAPSTTPVYGLSDDDFVAEDGEDPVQVARLDPYAVANVQRLECFDRANQYAATPVEARDQNAIEQFGLRIGSTVTAHEICDLGIGLIAAQLILQRGLYIRNSYSFKLSWECCLLEPMDIVTLTDAGLGLAATPVRITAIEEDAEGLLAVTAEEFPGGTATVAAYAAPVNQATLVNRNVAPAPVNAPVIVEPPAQLTGGAPQIWAAVSGGTNDQADPNWGGANVWVSRDGTTFSQVGQVTAPARQGIAAVALPAFAGANPDMADTLAVDLGESGGVLSSASVTDAANGVTLAVVDHELLAYATATLTAMNRYALTGLQRGLYGSQAAAHAAGAPFARLDGAIFKYTLPAGTIGTPLTLKFQSFNIYGGAAQDLSTCAPYTVTPVGSGLFGPTAQEIATGASFDEGLASQAATQTDDYGQASDPYTSPLDDGLASDLAASLAVASGGTGATTPAAARANIGAAAAGANMDITSLVGLTTPIAVSGGGTGATTPASARSGLGAAASGANADIYQLSALTTAILVAQGGTGSTTTAGARYNLGAAAAGANTDITSLGGLSMALTVGQGGTGATTPAAARQALGVAASGANADITSLTGLSGIGIGTSLDPNNPFVSKAATALFDHVGGGVVVALDKASVGASACHQFETGYSGRAQAGLLASDRYRVSVSATGASFTQALDVDPATGHVGLAGYTADANNALGVTGTACLFTAAADSMRFTFNKVSAVNDATLTFETGFSARALLGTTGSDAFQLKVSPDGSSFFQVYVADQTTGNIAFKALLGPASYTVSALPASAPNGALAFASNGRKSMETPGNGTGVLVAYSNGAWHRLSDDSVVGA